MRREGRHSFTLIEMLIVVVVIGILTGMVFKLISMANRKSEKLRTISILERVSYALNEFRAEYGQYPPSSEGMSYWYNNVTKEKPKVQKYFQGTPDAEIFKYGLVSYLVTRDRPGASKNLNGWKKDEAKDEAVKKRWSPYLLDPPSIVSFGLTDTNNFTPGGASGGESMQYSKYFDTIRDAWNHDLGYVCNPPYQIYDLWSNGPTDDPADDIHKSNKWDE